ASRAARRRAPFLAHNLPDGRTGALGRRTASRGYGDTPAAGRRRLSRALLALTLTWLGCGLAPASAPPTPTPTAAPPTATAAPAAGAATAGGPQLACRGARLAVGAPDIQGLSLTCTVTGADSLETSFEAVATLVGSTGERTAISPLCSGPVRGGRGQCSGTAV